MKAANHIRIEAAERHFQALGDLLQNQPAADDLDQSAAWLTELNAEMARFSEVLGDMETMFSEVTFQTIKAMDDKEFKRVGNSSTILERYVKGSNPRLAAILEKLRTMEKMIREVCQNTRTLMVSFRDAENLERAGSTVNNQR